MLLCLIKTSQILQIVFFKNVSLDLSVLLCPVSYSLLYILSSVLFDGFCGLLGTFWVLLSLYSCAFISSSHGRFC